ncbi:MAG: hypothetical protein HKN07_07395 [Acidimicrobiia bacterium]|nr:hypothetical protein [Acidimicrobiia bacterium]
MTTRRRRPLIPLGLLALLSFGLGLVGIQSFLETTGGDTSPLNVVFGAASLFTSGGLLTEPELPWQLKVAQLTSPAITFWAVVLTVLSVLGDRVRMSRAHSLSRHTVVVGAGKTGQAHLQALAGRDLDVVVVDADPAESVVSLCRTERWTLFTSDFMAGWSDTDERARAQHVLARAGVKSARSVFVAAGNDAIDIELARRISVLAALDTAVTTAIQVQIDTPELCSALTSRQLSLQPPPGAVIEYIDRTTLGAACVLEVMAEELRAEYSTVEESAVTSVVVVGETARGRVLLSVLDRSRVARELLGLAPLSEHPPLHARDFDSTVALGLGDSDSTLFLVDDDLDAVLRIAEQWPTSVTIAIAATGSDPYRLDLPGRSGQLLVVDPDVVMQTPVALKNGPIELMARLIHADYLAKHVERHGKLDPSKRSHRSWDVLSERYRESNRDQARNFSAVLESAGFELSAASGRASVALDPALIDRFAKLEHQRWMNQERKSWLASNKSLPSDLGKIHADMVDWRELTEEKRELDRDAIRRLPALAAVLGMVVTPVGES